MEHRYLLGTLHRGVYALVAAVSLAGVSAASAQASTTVDDDDWWEVDEWFDGNDVSYDATDSYDNDSGDVYNDDNDWGEGSYGWNDDAWDNGWYDTVGYDTWYSNEYHDDPYGYTYYTRDWYDYDNDFAGWYDDWGY